MLNNNNINHSYWELRQFFRDWDVIVIGGGIVGLSTAISHKEKHPGKSVLVIERGILPAGASTKNAGFACFGSPGELLHDLSTMAEKTVWETVKMRWDGLRLLKKRLGTKNLDYQQHGGYELFYDPAAYEQTLDRLTSLNKKVKAVTGISDCFAADKKYNKQFSGIAGIFLNRHEGQIDTGLMMVRLEELARKKGVVILNGLAVKNIQEHPLGVKAQTDQGDFSGHKIVVATNGFARELLHLEAVRPARAQVLVTSPIKGLKIKGTFHLDQGYFYFRNVHNRLLFGGGRNLDMEQEFTTQFGMNDKIQSHLDQLLRDKILKGYRYNVEHRWSGIMGVGPEKQPIIRHVSPHVIAAVRMGGMGIAIGSWVGEQAAALAVKR